MSTSSTTPETKSGFAPILHTPRLTLLLCDLSNSLHIDLNLVLLHDPVFQSNLGDYGIHTKADMLRLLRNTSIPAAVCPTMLDKPALAIYIMCLSPSSSAAAATSLAIPSPNDPALPFPSIHGKMIGLVTLASRSPTLPPDMGWGLFHQYANQGFATEAGRIALKYWRDECGITEIIAWPKETNIPSVKTARKLGFVENGFVVGIEDGSRHAMYTLPGMKGFEEGMRISFMGEDATEKLVI